MFSLHIDTALSWRGGQRQVLLTAQGLAARGHRVAVAANPDGELRRRLPASLEVVPLAARNEVDLPAAWQLSRVIRELQPDVVHAHESHGLAVAATALSIGAPPHGPALVASRRVDFHLSANSFSRWKHKQVNRFVAASDAIRAMRSRPSRRSSSQKRSRRSSRYPRSRRTPMRGASVSHAHVVAVRASSLRPSCSRSS